MSGYCNGINLWKYFTWYLGIIQHVNIKNRIDPRNINPVFISVWRPYFIQCTFRCENRPLKYSVAILKTPS